MINNRPIQLLCWTPPVQTPVLLQKPQPPQPFGLYGLPSFRKSTLWPSFSTLKKSYDTMWQHHIVKDFHVIGLHGHLQIFINFLSSVQAFLRPPEDYLFQPTLTRTRNTPRVHIRLDTFQSVSCETNTHKKRRGGRGICSAFRDMGLPPIIVFVCVFSRSGNFRIFHGKMNLDKCQTEISTCEELANSKSV